MIGGTAFVVVRHLAVGDELVIGLYHKAMNAYDHRNRENEADGPGYQNVEVQEMKFDD